MHRSVPGDSFSRSQLKFEKRGGNVVKRGPKPVPAHIRLIEGTARPRRHGSEDQLREQIEASAASFGPLKMPKSFKGEAAFAWRRFIAPAAWLDA
jgi:hypothetical protein